MPNTEDLQLLFKLPINTEASRWNSILLPTIYNFFYCFNNCKLHKDQHEIFHIQNKQLS